jgi:xanthine dehydrogenase YagT iron-sulfur-binding subunit
VLLDGRRVNSCLMLAVAYTDAEITTIEGLADGDELHPMQRSFIRHDAFQCGYCTPGQICSAVGMAAEAAAGWPSAVTADLTEPVELSDAEIRERMSGNLCRCAAYANIVPAIAEVAR